MTKIERWALAALVTGIALTLSACGGEEPEGPTPAEVEATQKASSTPPQPPTKPIVEPDEKGEIRYSGNTQTGESFTAQIGGDVELPSAFGADVPTFPGSTATSAMETGGGTAIAALDTEADRDDVVDFYRDQLGSQGWSIVDENELGRGTFVTATKDGRRILVNVESRDQGSRVTLSIAPAG